MQKRIIILAIVSLFSLRDVSMAASAQFQAISLVAILSAPTKWCEKEILTSGFLVHTNRGSFLYLGEADAANYLLENSIAVVGYGDQQSQLKSLSRSYVTVKGIFRAADSEEVLQAPIKGVITVTEILRPNGEKP
jgi:hypothetical protein